MDIRYRHLSLEERTVLQLALERGLSLRAIAAELGRAPSTLSRERTRNLEQAGSAAQCQGGARRTAGYRAVAAQARARQRAEQPRVPRRLVPGAPLWEELLLLLRRRHSPQQIVSILRRMHPTEPERRVSHETIYTAIYAMPRGELRREIIACLRRGHRRRRSRAGGEERRGRLRNMVSIHQRPPEIEERLVPGHWEGDYLKGQRGASAVGTLVERRTLFVTLAKILGPTAEDAVDGFSRVLQRIDVQRRLSLTYDQGKEMARHQMLSERTGIKVYFADPHSPWQRARNENTNGLLRQYLPRNADLSTFTQDQLDGIAWELNTRPRKSLGWKCPAELFMPESFDYAAYYKATVALRT